MTKKDFFNGCFPANWVEIEISSDNKAEKEDKKIQPRKDLATLLAELEEIKNSFERIQEKKIRLQNLMMFYRGELATS